MKKLGVFLLVFGGAALFNRAELSSVDEGFIFNTTAALVEKGSWTMDERLSDRSLSRFSPLPSLFAAPFYAVADKFVAGPSAVGMPKKRDWLLFACGLSSCFLTAWTAVALVGLIRQLGYSESSAVWTSLLWAFGTLAFPYSSSLFHQVIATLLMVYVVRFAFAEQIVPTIIVTALLASVQLTLAAAVLPLAFRDGWKPNRRSLIGLLLGILFGFGLHVFTNWLRLDHWLHGAYETETFTTPTFVGFVGLFFSSGKGLLWFAPLAFAGMLMLLPFAHRRPEIGRPLLFAVVCHCLVVIHWWAWHGSLSWGPRLLLPVMPLMMIPVADFLDRRMEFVVWQRRLLGSAAAVSIAINVWAATQPMIEFLERIPAASMSEWMFVPSLGPLLNSLAPPRLSTPTWLFFTAFAVLLVLAWVTVGLRHSDFLRRGRAPWALLTMLAISLAIGALDSGSRPTGHVTGDMELPIRGMYRFEYSGPPTGFAEVANRRLTQRSPQTMVEAPPMKVYMDADPSQLKWTLPGDGEYRSSIPIWRLPRGERGVSLFGEASIQFPKYNFLLWLLAVPLYFDWLLGGRKMKSVPGEP
jgi:hypothetical protein